MQFFSVVQLNLTTILTRSTDLLMKWKVLDSTLVFLMYFLFRTILWKDVELESCTCHNKSSTCKEGSGKSPHRIHFPTKSSEPCLWFLLRSKSCMLWNSMEMILVRKAMGNHLIKSTSLQRTQSPVFGFC